MTGPSWWSATTSPRALASRNDDVGESDLDRVLSYIVTYDRGLVLEAARFLIGKILPVTIRAVPEG